MTAPDAAGGADAPRGRARSLAALRERGFAWFFGGQLVSTVGAWMQMAAQAWLVLDLTGSARSLGITTALQFLPMLLLGPWAGVVADRVDKRRLLLVTNVAAGLVALTLGLLVVTDRVTITLVYVLAVAVGLANVFDRGVGPAFVAELVPAEHLPSAIGLYGITNSGARMLGPGAAGLVISQWGTGPCFLINALSFVVVLAALFRLRHHHRHTARTGNAGGVRVGLAHVRSRLELQRTLLATLVIGTFTFNFITMVPSMINFTFGAGAGAFGLAEVFSGLGSILAGLVVGGFRRPTTRTVAVTGAALGVTCVTAGLSPNLVTFFVLMFGIGITSAAYTTTAMSVVQLGSDAAVRGRVTSLLTLAMMGTTPIGSLVMGFLTERWSARTAMVVAGSAAIVTAGVLALAVARLPEPRVEPDVAALPAA